MKYIVEVREPVPSNLDKVASKVAASFHISDDKALALLRRAPGAVTRAVSEREADLVAGIFVRAGLNVVKRPAEDAPTGAAEGAGAGARGVAGPPEAEPSVAERAATEAEAGLSSTASPVAESPSPSDESASGAAHWAGAGEPALDDAVEESPSPGVDAPYGRGADASLGQGDAESVDVWNRPLEADEASPVDGFSRRDDFEADADLGWGTEVTSDVDAEGIHGVDEVGDGVPLIEQGPDAFGQASEEGALEVGDEVEDEVDEASGFGSEALGAGEPPELAGAAGGLAADVPEVGRHSQTPETVRRSQTPETMRRSQTPEMVRRSQTPETMRSTQTRAPGETALQRGGLRRRVANAAILPALLTLVVMIVAMVVTVMPLLRSQQQGRAADAAHAEATTLEALTGGMPLTAQTLLGPLTDLARRSQAVLGGSGARLMVVTDATGAPVAGWYGAATTPAAIPPDVRQAVSGRALAAMAGQTQGGESFTQNLRATWHGVLAMVGLGTADAVYGAAPVMSAGQAVGAVVVGVKPASASNLVDNAFLTTLLVGLVPVLVAILVAMGLTRGLRAQVSYLLEAADRISRGDLEEAVELESRDELGQLARAIERMRVSLQEGMERLRRRR